MIIQEQSSVVNLGMPAIFVFRADATQNKLKIMIISFCIQISHTRVREGFPVFIVIFEYIFHSWLVH